MIDPFSFFIGALSYFSLFKIAKLTYRIYPYFLNSTIKKSQIISNQYIIVSGATDGIGLQYVKYFSKLNYKIFAIGKDSKKLQQLKKSFSNIKTLLIDYNQQIDSQNILLTQKNLLQNEIEPKPTKVKIKGIINCAGIAHFSNYQHLTNQQIKKINKVNINSINFKLKMLENMISKQFMLQDSFFINVSSALAQFPQKYSSVYSATKAYQSHILKSIAMQNKNVIFLDVKPWYVKTKMVNYQDTQDTALPQQIVQGSIKVLGRRLQCNGCLKHEILSEFSSIWSIQLQKRIQKHMQKLLKMKQLRKKKINK